MTLRSPKVDHLVKRVRIKRKKKMLAEYLPQEEGKMGLSKTGQWKRKLILNIWGNMRRKP